MSEAYQSLTHSRWHCKYHVVFVPNRRRKALSLLLDSGVLCSIMV